MSDKVKEYNIADSYKMGDTIHHQIYGTGEVIECKVTEGGHDMITVRFGIEGDKDIVSSYKSHRQKEEN
jgi:hypothetical protein